MIKLLQPAELAQLTDLTPPIPPADAVFEKSIGRFARARTSQEFRTIVETIPYRGTNEDYDEAKHADAAWVNLVILAMYVLHLLRTYYCCLN